jgi:imidazolonepropionase-like amidohydrolase
MAADISTLIVLSSCLAGARTVPSERRIPVRTGHLFVGTGKLASNQVVLIKGERITEVGPAEKMRVPAAAVVIGLSQATVLPGSIDAHTHVLGNGSDFETQRRSGRRRG